MFLSFQVRWTAPAEMTPCIDGYQVKALGNIFPLSYFYKQYQNAVNNINNNNLLYLATRSKQQETLFPPSILSITNNTKTDNNTNNGNLLYLAKVAWRENLENGEENGFNLENITQPDVFR